MGRLLKRKTSSVKKTKSKALVDDNSASRSTGSVEENGESTASQAELDPKRTLSSTRKISASTKTPSWVMKFGFVEKSIQFLREVKAELKKVAWPSRKQTLGLTIVVLIVVFIVAIFLGGADMLLSFLVRLVLQ